MSGHIIKRHWQSYWDFLQDAQKPPISDDRDYSHSRINGSDGQGEWSGTKTFEEALDMAERGWKDSEKVVKGTINLPFVQEDPCAFYWDVQGTGVDISRYCQGEPECMFEFQPSSVVKKVIDIWVGGGFSAGIDTDHIRMRGAWMMQMIDILEQHGHQCNVRLISASSAPGCAMYLSVDLKSPGYALNRDLLAFAMCHNAFFRRIMFGLWESDPEMYEKYLIPAGSGYGRMNDGWAPNEGECDIFIPAITWQHNAAATKERVKAALLKYGIELEAK